MQLSVLYRDYTPLIDATYTGLAAIPIHHFPASLEQMQPLLPNIWHFEQVPVTERGRSWVTLMEMTRADGEHRTGRAAGRFTFGFEEPEKNIGLRASEHTKTARHWAVSILQVCCCLVGRLVHELQRTVPGLLSLSGLSDAYSDEHSDEDEAWLALRPNLHFCRRLFVWCSSVVARGVPHPVASSS